jgi:hypothetical protein
MTSPSQLAEASSKVEVRFGTTQPQRRVTVFFRLILVAPQLIVLLFVGIGAYFVTIVGWFAALFTGRLPESIAKFLLGYVRWTTRLNAYLYLMVDVYPPFSLDPDPAYPVDVIVTTGRLNRVAVFFRIILIIPALIVFLVLNQGMATFAFITWIVTLVKGKMPDAFFGASAAVFRYQARFIAYYLMLTSWYPSDIMGDKDLMGNKFEFPVSGTWIAPPPVPSGVFGLAPGWGAAPQGASFTVPPPPPDAYPPPPLGLPAEGIPPGTPVASPESFGAPTEAPTSNPPAMTTGVPGTGLSPSPEVGRFAGAMPPPPPPYGGAMPPPPPPGVYPFGSPGWGWPLVLASGARVLTVVFIVIGAVSLVFNAATFRFSFNLNSIETTVARDATQGAYQSLASATNTFKAQTQACTAQSSPSDLQLHCLEQADSAWASSIQAYSTALSVLIYPSSAQSAANAAQSAASRAVTTVDRLAASLDTQSYSTASQSQAFQSTLNNVDTTYTALIQALGG